MTYKEFIDHNLITEEEFNKVAELIPSCGAPSDNYNCYNNIYEYLVAGYLEANTQYAWADDIDDKFQSLYIYDLEYDEVEKVFKELKGKGWTIINENSYTMNCIKNSILDAINECEDLEVLNKIKNLL